MNKVLLFFSLWAVSTCLSSQSWILIEDQRVNSLSDQPKKLITLKSKTFHLEYNQFVSTLVANAKRGKHNVVLPLPNGAEINCILEEESIMEEELARKYPNIKAYSGFDSAGKFRVRIDIGPNGLNAVITSKEDGMIIISPLYSNETAYYQSYYLKDAPDTEKSFMCGTENLNPTIRHSEASLFRLRSSNFKRLEYRYAVACTGEWGKQSGSKEAALAAIVTSVNLLNSIFEIELGLKLILIKRNDELIFIDPATDPYTTPDNGRTTLQSNTGIINTIVGADAYDIGHVYTLRCTDVGGVAYLNSICTARKGGGVTCFPNTNYHTRVSRVVSHEIGHQLGANHTFSSCLNSTNVVLGNNFEPGSGSTIMSYGGTCGTDNVVSTSDTYFHNASLLEIAAFIRNPEATGFSCANKINTDNYLPEITQMPASGITIPRNTPFILEAEAIDANNDELFFCWEQKDLSTRPRLALGDIPFPAQISYPSFRSFPPRKENYRIIPEESTILSNAPSNTEIIHIVGDREINFALTVRDKHPEGGGTVWENTMIKAAYDIGPFEVTFPNTEINLKSDSFINVTWDVANTDKEPVNCKFVDIYLSIAGKLYHGDSMVIPLLLNTPNDGNEVIKLPSKNIDYGRFIIKASDNIFFNINKANFSVEKSEKQKAYFEFSKHEKDLCIPLTKEISLLSSGINSYDGNIKYEIVSNIQGINAKIDQNEVKVGKTSNLTLDFNESVKNGRYEILIRGIGENQDTLTRNLIFDVNSSNFNDLSFIDPQNEIKSVGLAPEFKWSISENADYYQLQVASSPNFSHESIILNDTTSLTTFKFDVLLDKNKIYFARVVGYNECFEQKDAPFIVFGSSYADCQTFNITDLPYIFPNDSKRTFQTSISILEDFEIESISVNNLKIDHSNFSDLKMTITSPLDSTITVFENICPYYLEFNGGFSDNYSNLLTCSNSNQKQFKPKQPFSTFSGKPSKGDWLVSLTDSESFNGGIFKSLAFELCKNVPILHPLLNIPNILTLPFLESVTITSQNLYSSDGISNPNELIYTITSVPYYGNVLLNMIPLKLGDKFSQLDINSGNLKYSNSIISNHIQNMKFLDSIGVIVYNNRRGFDGIKFMKIELQDTNTSINDVPKDSFKVFAYPNPSNENIKLIIPPSFDKEIKLKVFDLAGQLVIYQFYTTDQEIDIQTLTPGIYLFSVANEDRKAFGKFIKY